MRKTNYFGQTKIFGKLLADVKELEEHGFVTSSGDIVRATIVAIIGDNLGSHCIGGYTQNFSTAKHWCIAWYLAVNFRMCV